MAGGLVPEKIFVCLTSTQWAEFKYAGRSVNISAKNTKALEHSANMLRIEAAAVPIGITCMTLAVFGVWWFFAEHVDALLLNIWLAYMAAAILLLTCAHIIIVVREPPIETFVGFWGPLGKGLNLVMVFGSIASIWLLMPAADDVDRYFLIIIYMGYVIIHLMIHGEGMRLLTTAAILGIFGSLIAYLLIYPMPYSIPIVAYLAMMTVAMFWLQQVFRGAVRDALIARIVSESATEELDRALAAVITERDTKTRFLESASHDLRQPLQAARMFFDQTQRSLPGAQHDKAVESLHWALDAADQSLTQILEHLRLDAGEIKPNSRVFGIGPLIAHMADFNEPHSQLSNSDIIALPSRLEVLADPALVERALGNLIGNAIRHARASRILIGAKRHKGRVKIWVIDDGVGIPVNDQAVIFENYVQGSNHGDEIRGGFGLGLATVNRLATLMGGTAGLDERWRNGSAFWLELPGGTD